LNRCIRSKFLSNPTPKPAYVEDYVIIGSGIIDWI
jgi:hypothetical protein